MATEQKFDTVQSIMEYRNRQATKTLVDNMAAEYAHQLSSFPALLDFTEKRNDVSRQLQTNHMIEMHGACPKIGVASTYNTLGHTDWGIELTYLLRNTHPNTPSLETLFHQHVDASMTAMDQEHARIAGYLVYRQRMPAVPLSHPTPVRYSVMSPVHDSGPRPMQ
jgi:hypothetical protein